MRFAKVCIATQTTSFPDPLVNVMPFQSIPSHVKEENEMNRML